MNKYMVINISILDNVHYIALWSVVMCQASNMALRKCFKAAVHIPHTRETSVNGNIIDWILLNIYHVSIYLYTTRRRYYSS